MLTLTNNNILKFLQERGYIAEEQKETNQLSVILNIENIQYPMFIRRIPEGPILQLLVFLPCSLREQTLLDVSRLLHLINKEMDIPGFGMDETAKVIFYRITLPVLDNTIDPLLFDTYLKSFQAICKSFAPAIINVVQGTMSFEAVLQNAKVEHEKAKEL